MDLFVKSYLKMKRIKLRPHPHIPLLSQEKKLSGVGSRTSGIIRKALIKSEAYRKTG
jgi:hypothetical protein